MLLNLTDCDRCLPVLELQKPRLETKKAIFLLKNGFFIPCAHLGSNLTL